MGEGERTPHSSGQISLTIWNEHEQKLRKSALQYVHVTNYWGKYIHALVKCPNYRKGVLSEEEEVFGLYSSSRHLEFSSVNSISNALILSSTLSMEPVPIIGAALLEINHTVVEICNGDIFLLDISFNTVNNLGIIWLWIQKVLLSNHSVFFFFERALHLHGVCTRYNAHLETMKSERCCVSCSGYLLTGASVKRISNHLLCFYGVYWVGFLTVNILHVRCEICTLWLYSDS